ncbi:MAG: glucokinase [Proteobacteria bacterium]|nr:glucokinase [Pseudomonadota bacterium]
MADKSLLIGDIGGTNARFALANRAHPGYQDKVELKCTDFETSVDAVRHYLTTVGVPVPDAICLAAAGPVVDHGIDVTNNHWTLSTASLASEFDLDSVRLLNDFEAIAYSIPFIGPEDRLAVGAIQGPDLEGRDFDIAILGPGTGLGVAGLCNRGDAMLAITGEGGHVGFAPESDEQAELLRILRPRFGRVSAERLVAGSGIENIHAALLELHGGEGRLSAREIGAAAAGPGVAAEAVRLFFEILGQAAGDLALTLGANDGVYIAGGIAKRYPEVLADRTFRAAFESKGRHRRLMERIPTYLITHTQPGLLGASFVAQELVAGAA